MEMLDYHYSRITEPYPPSATPPLLQCFFPLRLSLTLSILLFFLCLLYPPLFLYFHVTLLSLSNSGGFRRTLAPLFCSELFRSSTFVSPAGLRWRWRFFFFFITLSHFLHLSKGLPRMKLCTGLRKTWADERRLSVLALVKRVHEKEVFIVHLGTVHFSMDPAPFVLESIVFISDSCCCLSKIKSFFGSKNVLQRFHFRCGNGRIPKTFLKCSSSVPFMNQNKFLLNRSKTFYFSFRI